MGDASLLERILDGAEDPTNLSLQLLKDITDNFSEARKIGQGGFGEVYKGVLRQRTVAVKRIYINENTVDDRLFRGEFASLWNTSNRNVVRILGVCSEVHHKPMKVDGPGELIWTNVLERLLCFEYIWNGSLDKHITDELRGFEWETRYEIITGICKGLRYLHEEKKIIHMDLKPANILLHHQDEKYMVPKITDFGLSRPNEKSHTMGKRYGTLGYMAPEYREHGKTTQECDIYSLGAIITELVTGCKDVPNKENVLRRWRHRWKKAPTQIQYQQVNRCIDMAIRCRKQDPKERPSISKIISFLSESESTHSQMSPLLDEDDMLGINPLELRFHSDLNKGITSSIELTNGTHKCIAFNIQLPNLERYNAQPVKGIMRPGSKYDVMITMIERDVHRHVHADKLVVQSMEVSEDLGEEEITERMSGVEAFKVVDEVDLMVVYEPMKTLKNSMNREDINMAKKRKTGLYSSGKGKKELGSNENREVASVDISSSLRGKYTYQLDRRNFHPPENFSHSQTTNMTYLVRASDRATDVTRGAMGSLLHKMGVLDKEFDLKTSIEKDADQLLKMQQVLRNMADVQQDNLDDMVKRWASNARDMSYDLEDFVDSFLIHRELTSDGSFRKLTHEMYLEKGKINLPIDDLIKNHISKRVQDAAEKCKECMVKNIVANVTTKVDIEDPRISTRYIEREQLIGMEAPKKKLISLLEEDADKSKLQIVSIFGLGGLGKTTLAQSVYEDLKGYHPKAFVPVGRNPDVKEVLNEIVCELDSNFSASNLNVRMLLNKVNELLKNKRFFIVIDDIWDKKEWNVIRKAFPENNNGSRVMITTRDYDVALPCCNFEENFVYEIKRLRKEYSRRLFFRTICGPKNDFPISPREEEISNDILKKCGGMPLAINSIASLLAGKPVTTWEYIWKSLGGLAEGNEDLENMNKILELSYIHLPGHLKTCLLYICMYPEDREIDKNDLLLQWVAEGLVITNGGQLDVVDVAEEYFKKLINVCMIQPGKIDCYNNEVLSCRVHDIIHDLMRSKSGKENCIHVIDGLKDVSGQIRRVSVHCNDQEDSIILETIKGSLEHARSVLLYRASLLADFLKYKYIRVLHLEYKAQQDLDLTLISTLFLLRYLKVAWSHNESSFKLNLPDQIGQLQQLETIVLEGYVLKNYPSDIITLPWLSRLIYRPYRRFEGIALPDGINKLKSLRTLVGVCSIQSSVETIKGLSELTNLRNLELCSGFFRKSDEEIDVRRNALHSSISRLSTSLRTFTLEGGSQEGYDMSRWSKTLFSEGSHIGKLHLVGFRFQRCPEWIGQLHHLYSLSIEVREVAGCISIVQGCPSLAYFEFSTNKWAETTQGSVVIPGGGAFQALRELCFCCSKTPLTFEEGALPKLEKLSIMFHVSTYRRFESDIGIEHLPARTLKHIRLQVMIAPGERYDQRKILDLLDKSIIDHHPGVKIHYEFCKLQYGEHSDDEEDYCTQEDDEGSYQVSGSQTSAQVQANTRQVELIEAHEGYGRMRTNNTDVPPASVDLTAGLEGRQSGGTQDWESWQQPLYLQHVSEHSVHVPDWESCLELPFPCSLPSYHELTQPRSELNWPSDDLNDELIVDFDELIVDFDEAGFVL